MRDLLLAAKMSDAETAVHVVAFVLGVVIVCLGFAMVRLWVLPGEVAMQRVTGVVLTTIGSFMIGVLAFSNWIISAILCVVLGILVVLFVRNNRNQA